MPMNKILTKWFICAYFKIIMQGDNMKEKTKQLLAYIIQHHPPLPITSLMKLSYIVDLISIKKYEKQVSNFEYIRYKYGPFNNKIYEYMQDLLKDNIISEEPAYTPMGDEYILYKFNEESIIVFDKLTDNEKEIVNEVLDSLLGYGAKALVDLAYRTKPMERIGAKQDNDVGLNAKLDLRAD